MPAAADGGGLQLQLLAVGVPDLDDRRVGVGVPQVDLIHGEVQTRLLRLLKGEGDPHIVGVHAQQTRHQRPIGAVAGAGLGKGAVEVDLGLHRLTAQQCTGHLADAAAPAVWELEGPTITGLKYRKCPCNMASCRDMYHTFGIIPHPNAKSERVSEKFSALGRAYHFSCFFARYGV